MSKKYKKAWMKTLSGICGNISAAWLGLTFITPNFVGLANFHIIIVLIRDIFFGIVFLLLAVYFERKSL